MAAQVSPQVTVLIVLIVICRAHRRGYYYDL